MTIFKRLNSFLYLTQLFRKRVNCTHLFADVVKGIDHVILLTTEAGPTFSLLDTHLKHNNKPIGFDT